MCIHVTINNDLIMTNNYLLLIAINSLKKSIMRLEMGL